MDTRGWVEVDQLICNINAEGVHHLTRAQLEQIVAEDKKGRYRFSEDGRHIKACQGHSIPWVQPELTELPPLPYLYHGTTEAALAAILQSGAIRKMERHAVHLSPKPDRAWQSARRWKKQQPVVLQIDAQKMATDGYVFGKTENDVWCCEQIPMAYIKTIQRKDVSTQMEGLCSDILRRCLTMDTEALYAHRRQLVFEQEEQREFLAELTPEEFAVHQDRAIEIALLNKLLHLRSFEQRPPCPGCRGCGTAGASCPTAK